MLKKLKTLFYFVFSYRENRITRVSQLWKLWTLFTKLACRAEPFTIWQNCERTPEKRRLRKKAITALEKGGGALVHNLRPQSPFTIVNPSTSYGHHRVDLSLTVLPFSTWITDSRIFCNVSSVNINHPNSRIKNFHFFEILTTYVSHLKNFWNFINFKVNIGLLAYDLWLCESQIAIPFQLQLWQSTKHSRTTIESRPFLKEHQILSLLSCEPDNSKINFSQTIFFNSIDP